MRKDEFVKILFLLDNQEMTAKMIATGKSDQRITTTLDRAEADFRQNEPNAVAKDGLALIRNFCHNLWPIKPFRGHSYEP